MAGHAAINDSNGTSKMAIAATAFEFITALPLGWIAKKIIDFDETGVTHTHSASRRFGSINCNGCMYFVVSTLVVVVEAQLTKPRSNHVLQYKPPSIFLG